MARESDARPLYCRCFGCGQDFTNPSQLYSGHCGSTDGKGRKTGCHGWHQIRKETPDRHTELNKWYEGWYQTIGLVWKHQPTSKRFSAAPVDYVGMGQGIRRLRADERTEQVQNPLYDELVTGQGDDNWIGNPRSIRVLSTHVQHVRGLQKLLDNHRVTYNTSTQLQARLVECTRMVDAVPVGMELPTDEVEDFGYADYDDYDVYEEAPTAMETGDIPGMDGAGDSDVGDEAGDEAGDDDDDVREKKERARAPPRP